MALHYELPVYKASYDMLLEIFQFTKEISKEYKYTVGESLKKETQQRRWYCPPAGGRESMSLP